MDDSSRANQCEGMPTSDLRKLVGQRVRRTRELAGLSQEELAARARLDRTAIGKIERGERGVTIATLQKIAKSLKSSISELLEGI